MAMNEEKSGTRDFRPDYAMLELDDRANWSAVRDSYRHLVHVWHPDRFAQRPRELTHAQQQFISLTKSYTRLRNFYRRYGHMPFEPSGNRASTDDRETHTRETASLSEADTDSHDNSGVEGPVEPGVLGRSVKGRALVAKPRSRTRLIWTLASGVVLVATVSIFFILDQKANQAIIERAREAVREAPPSEFMPSAAEIRRGEAKGAFIQPTQ